MVNNKDLPMNNNNNMSNSAYQTPNTAAMKRGRDLLLKGVDTPNSKTPRTAEYENPRTMQLMDQKLAKQTEQIVAQINSRLFESEQKILSEINVIKQDLIAVTNRVAKLEALTPDIQLLTAEVNKLKKQMAMQENSVVAADLRITGIPYNNNENLFNTFNIICDSIGAAPPIIKQIFRINRNQAPNRNNNDGVIIVKLTNPYDKNQILKSVSAFRRETKNLLRLRDSGIESDKPIYINECLTKTNHAIFQSAYHHKKQKQLFSVFTMRGLVHVRRAMNDCPTLVETMQQLEDFVCFRVEHRDISSNNNYSNDNNTHENQLGGESMQNNSDKCQQ